MPRVSRPQPQRYILYRDPDGATACWPEKQFIAGWARFMGLSERYYREHYYPHLLEQLREMGLVLEVYSAEPLRSTNCPPLSPPHSLK